MGLIFSACHLSFTVCAGARVCVCVRARAYMCMLALTGVHGQCYLNNCAVRVGK